MQGSGSRLESTCTVCGCSPQNRWVTWLNHKNKTRGSVGGDGIRACPEALMSGDTWWDRRACVGRMQIAVKAWPPDEEECYLTILPLRGVYLLLCSRGSLVICPTRRDFMYIALGFQGNSSIRTASHFPCSLG
jgi:hypothetical protein